MFENKNIKLRKLSINDYLTYHNWRNDIEVMKSTSPELDIYTLEETESFINMIVNQPNAKGYMIEDIEDGETVGIISLINIDYKNRSGECIIDIGQKEKWGKGIGREAMSILMDYAFNELNLHRLYLQVFSFNERAIKLYERLGFKQDGKFREAVYRDGKWHDIIIMNILKREYLEK